MQLSQHFQELRHLVDEVAEVNWRHPSWWVVLAGAALARERSLMHSGSKIADDYLASTGTTYADTFMGRAMATSRPLSTSRAVARARAALDTLEFLDGEFPKQPLKVYLSRRRGHYEPRRLPDPRRIVFIRHDGAFITRMPDSTEGDVELAKELASREPGRRLARIDTASAQPVAAAVAVSLASIGQGHCRHLHRRAHTRGGGPWLAVGDADGLEIVTTCHTIVDGYGHACITKQIFTIEDWLRPSDLPSVPRVTLAVTTGDSELGIAHTILEGPKIRFSTMAYEFGHLLRETYGANGRYSPTFQVPVAPGDAADPMRRLRRVVPALLSLRGEEEFASFDRRCRTIIARERSNNGLMSRLLTAATHIPVPVRIKRSLVQSNARPSATLPISEVLAGRGCLSLLRFPNDSSPMPLFAASAPSLATTRLDGRGSIVLTIIANGKNGFAVTLAGNGIAGSPSGARRLLDRWIDRIGATSEHAVDRSATSEILPR